MPRTDDLETLRQYARCYILLLIGGYLMTDNSNNLVHLWWLPLLANFEKMTLQMRLLSNCRWSWDTVGAKHVCAPPTLWTSLMK
ncbi:hypothetical protein Ahy_A10g048527 [Arachis hypogaea]|uniref:Aminotransferase-like plant mobile domain-containing protein n=1 Tax=Arachis hypogaea TaxID=3818 RepID=A0A445B5G4_ARAHY|nr:hypothetical protein Ahy_A10g048527 [Arachis hypogaea]